VTADLSKSAALDQHLKAAIAEFSPQETRMQSMATPAASAGERLKAMMEAHNTKLQKLLDDQFTRMQQGMDKQLEGAAAVGKLADKVESQGDDLLAAAGQYANDLGSS
jgi:hypothetical protein